LTPSTPAASALAGGDECDGMPQNLCARAKLCKLRFSLGFELAQALARAIDPQGRDEGRRAGCRVLTSSFAHGRCRTFDVERVVGDLGGGAEGPAVAGQGAPVLLRRRRENSSGFRRESDECPRFHVLNAAHAVDVLCTLA